jgi:hypothetical protein
MFGPVRTLILAAGLYLPMAFFVWFYFARTVVVPVFWLAKLVLTHWMPDVFTGLLHSDQLNYLMDWVVNLPIDSATVAEAGGKQIGVTVTTNPMIYGYGLPVMAGLVMATPMRIRARVLQITIAALVTCLVQTNGVIWEAIKHVCFEAGPAGTAALLKHGLTPNIVGFSYQLSYLILSPLPPILLWILLNRGFIERLLHAHSFEDLEQDELDVQPRAEASKAEGDAT